MRRLMEEFPHWLRERRMRQHMRRYRLLWSRWTEAAGKSGLRCATPDWAETATGEVPSASKPNNHIN
eukprot:6214540-Pleurochrysis_carterae.AAC.2